MAHATGITVTAPENCDSLGVEALCEEFCSDFVVPCGGPGDECALVCPLELSDCSNDELGAIRACFGPGSDCMSATDCISAVACATG
jgi:hypothetical protein